MARSEANKFVARAPGPETHDSAITRMPTRRVCRWPKPKNSEIRNDAPSSRQPLVKGERLVRSELGAAMSGVERVCRVRTPFSRDAVFNLADTSASCPTEIESVADWQTQLKSQQHPRVFPNGPPIQY